MLPRFLKLRLAGLLFSWLAALSVVAWLVLAGRQSALERSERATAAFAATVVGDAHQLSPRLPKNDPEFQRTMARRLKDLPFVRAIFVIDADGWLMHDTVPPGDASAPPIRGLSQVYGFMQQLGGSLAIESAPGRGTSVKLLFPLAPAAPRERG